MVCYQWIHFYKVHPLFGIPDIDKERAEHEKTFKHFKCEYCDAQFLGKREYTEHRFECIHWMICEVCGKDFRTPEEQERYKKQDIFSKIRCKFSEIVILTLIISL